MLGTMTAGHHAYILVAVTDPALHPEAAHVAAASARPVVDLTENSAEVNPRDLHRHLSRAAAVLVDAEAAAHLHGRRSHDRIFFVGLDDRPLDWEAALACRAEQAFILPAQSAELLTLLGSLAEPEAGETAGPAGAAHVLAVTASGGGLGASTLSAAIARRAPGPVTVIDGVDNSGGLDLLFGLEDAPGARWPDLGLAGGDADGHLAPEDLRAALPAVGDGPAVLSAARPTIADPFRLRAGMLTTVLDSLRGVPGTVVLDVPAHLLDSAQLTAALDHVAVLTAAQVRPAAAAAALSRRLTAAGVDHSLLTRHRDWSGLDADDLAAVLPHAPVAEITAAARLARDSEIAGLPTVLPRTLTTAADAVLAAAGAA